jgi:ADP-ribosyltransferase exoenzyme
MKKYLLIPINIVLGIFKQTKMRNLKKYAQKYLKTELEKIQNSEIANSSLELTLEEKAIIYKYTDDDFTHLGINKQLRDSQGQNVTDFAKYLVHALSKIESYVGIVYRSTDLPELIFQQYQSALINRTNITEYAFLSATQLEYIAKKGYPNDFLFKIFSKNGKPIENISKFGKYSHDNEFEVVFIKGSQFKVLAIEKYQNHTLIVLKEV